jgi:hypothetical protein
MSTGRIGWLATAFRGEGYADRVKTIWTGRINQAAARYGEVAPNAAVCCNACRTCVQTNLVALAVAVIGGAGGRIARRAKRIAGPAPS